MVGSIFNASDVISEIHFFSIGSSELFPHIKKVQAIFQNFRGFGVILVVFFFYFLYYIICIMYVDVEQKKSAQTFLSMEAIS